ATSFLVSRLPSRDFLSRLRDDPALSWRLHRAQSQEVYEQAAQVANLGCQDARHRLEQLLDQLRGSVDGTSGENEVPVRLPMKQWEIAQLIAVTPQYLCQLL